MNRSAVRLDDPNVQRELACQEERANWIAKRAGLPAIGATLLNKHGIEWIVQSHAPAPREESLQRWRSGDVQPHMDMYPVIVPKNFSPQLMEFFHAIDRCTTKTFAIIDTMPGRRSDGHIPGGNSIDTICNPVTNLLYLDAARVHETVVAHELGHAWVQYVDDCEDYRMMEDASDPQRMRQVSHVQSYVLDLKVNDLLRRKGFDMRPIEEDQAVGLQQLAKALVSGYAPALPREEVFMALLVADQMLERDRGRGCELAVFDDSLAIIRDTRPPLAKLALRLADAVRQHGYDSQEGLVRSIDECLVASFEHCGDRLDLDKELVVVDPEEPNFDKFPAWLPPLAPKTKTSVGKFMARNDISSHWQQWLETAITGNARVHFMSPEGDRVTRLQLRERIGPPNRYSDLPDDIAEMLALKHLNTTKSYQLHGGPPHQMSDLHKPACWPEPPSAKPPAVPCPAPPSPIQPHYPVPLPGAPQGPNMKPRDSESNFPKIPGIRPPRPYMAGTGRFLTAARLQEQLAGEHPYAYAQNNPVTYTDPSGLQPRGRPGSGNERCKIYRCVTPTPPISHNFICVTSSTGRTCSGGSTPAWGGPGGLSDSTYGSCTGNEGVECHLISTDCRVADEICRMLDYWRNNPKKVPRYDATGLTSQNCVSFVDFAFCTACEHMLREVVRKGLPDPILLQLADSCKHCTNLTGYFGSDEAGFLRWLRDRFGS